MNPNEFLQLFIDENDYDNFVIIVDIFNRLASDEYIPTYIERTEDYYNFIFSIAEFISIYIKQIKDFQNIYADENLLKIFLLKRGMFLVGDESLVELQTIANNRLKILSRRGTLQMLDEIKRICNEETETDIEHLDLGEVGWVLGRTSPGYRSSASELNYCYLGVRKAVSFKLKNQNLTLSNIEIREILEKYFQPMHIKTFYNFI